MRTTIDLNAELLRRAKRAAADDGIPLREVIERALQSYLSGGARGKKPYKLRLKTLSGGGLAPGVSWEDFQSNARLRDIMDGLE